MPSGEVTIQRDLYLLWSASGEADLQLTNAGLLRVSDLKRVAVSCWHII